MRPVAVHGRSFLASIPIIVPPHLFGGALLSKFVHRHKAKVAQRHTHRGGSPRTGPTGLELAKGLEGEEYAVDLHVDVVPDAIHQSVGTLDYTVGGLGGGRGRIHGGFGRGMVLEAFHNLDVNLIDQYFNWSLFDVGKARDVESQAGHMHTFQLDQGRVAPKNVIEDVAIQIDRGDFTSTGEQRGIDLITTKTNNDFRQMLGKGVEQDGLHGCASVVVAEKSALGVSFTGSSKCARLRWCRRLAGTFLQ